MELLHRVRDYMQVHFGIILARTLARSIEIAGYAAHPS